MLILPGDFEDLIGVILEDVNGMDCGGRAQKQGRIITGRLIISRSDRKDKDNIFQLDITWETMTLNICITLHTL